MTTIKRHLLARDARDRLIDALGFGETYPLRDLPVDIEDLFVPQGLSAGIPIEASQRDCTYSLWSRTGEAPVMRVEAGTPVPAAVDGTGETVLLSSPPIENNITYKIRATRQTTQRWVYLRAPAEIKVGLDAKLKARVVSGDPLPQDIDVPNASGPRVIDYGSKVEVQVERSQSGVDYALVRVVNGAREVISEAEVRGNLGTIALRSAPLTEDTVLRVFGRMTIEVEGQAVVREVLLDAVMPVCVRPNAELAVSVDVSHIIDYHAAATVAVHGSQPGVQYQLYARLLGRDDIQPGSPPGSGFVEVPSEEGRVLSVRRPARASAWADPPGFQPLSEPAFGDGGALHMPTGTLADDSVIVIRAQRTYTQGGGESVAVATPLRQVAVILMRPNPAPPLRLRALMDGAQTRGALHVSGGQPGVFYFFSLSQGGAALGKPAYFYERLGGDPIRNVGVQLMRIGSDFVSRRDAWTDLEAPDLGVIEQAAVEGDLVLSNRPEPALQVGPQERATRAPEAPIVATGALPSGATLHIRALKARTWVSAPLAHTATIAAPPAAKAHAQDPYGPITSVIVLASRAEETYQALANGAAAGAPQSGNGQDLSLPVALPAEGALIDVLIRRGQEPAIVVEEVVHVPPPPSAEPQGA